MDRNKNKDWTDAVRERLEGRELTPPDALWERIEASAQPAGAERRVRRLPWGAAGAAAAAALAAVLLLRPAGAPEDGLIDVVPTPAPATPVAEAVVPDVVEEVAKEEIRSIAPLRMTEKVADDTEVPSGETALPVTEESSENTTLQEIPTNSQGATTGIRDKQETGTSLQDNHPERSEQSQTAPSEETQGSMSIDEYLASEAPRTTGARRLTASVYAAGRPTADFMLSNDYDEGYFGYQNSPNADSAIMADISGAGSSLQNSTGYTTDPENPSGYYNPMKYTNDPYNINGLRMNHSRPVSFGISVTYPLNDHIFLESGLYYSVLKSSSFRTSDQILHSVGAPLKLGYRFGQPGGRFSFSVSAGAKVEKCIYAVRTGERVKEPGLQLAAAGSAALQYNFSQRAGLFLAPELSYWFTRTQLPTYNTEHPLNLSLKAGINLTLNR